MKNVYNYLSYSDLEKEKNNAISALEFICIGIASHALCLIDSAGILKIFNKKGHFPEELIQEFNNSHLVRAALVTLVGANVLSMEHKRYKLTSLGKELVKNIGLLTVPLTGYRKLFSEQLQILCDSPNTKHGEIDFVALASASNDFGVHELDPLLLEIFKNLQPKGTICDLGCGSGGKLAKICMAINAPGLGIEQNVEVVQENQERLADQSIEIIQGDITALESIWEDVDSILMSFVCHDIISSDQCSNVLKSLQINFPRMRYFVIVDVVSPSEKVPTIMPGFDYVHGLQGVTTRTYEETISVFVNADYEVFDEFKVPNMPNTFVWILRPLKKR